ncbi:hypothetical protein D3C78_1686530 [compost metagenome]
MNLSCNNGKLLFSCENSVESPATKSENGIGLVNLKRRLELLYPNKHELVIENKPDSYKITLKLI